MTKIFGDPNKKIVQSLQPIVDRINELESGYKVLTNEALKKKTKEFKERLTKGETLDDILPEAFATVREASRRTTGMRHFDVQLVGGIALHRGRIAEMRTGEGKTLVATLPLYLNALVEKGTHLVTVNDYLARRDAVWMGQIYDFLGMSVGVIQNQRVSFIYDSAIRLQTPDSNNVTNTEVRSPKSEVSDEKHQGGAIDIERDDLGSFRVQYDYLRPASRQEAYRSDITYGTNNEFGFDYLRDNMVQTLDEMVMRHSSEMNYAIIDEVDSILIDEARTPLIISSPAEEAAEQYYQFAELTRRLKVNEDYNVDEKMRSVSLTDEGIKKFEGWLGVENIYAEGGIRMVHHVEQALKAEVLFKRDKEYVVDGNEIIIIDEFTGRKMPGRRYSEGLHQAIEAKEGVAIQRESQTLATITFQNLFRMYKKLGGMTGTAMTEAEEFAKIYNLEVVSIPTNKPDQRKNLDDRIYKTEVGKYKAVVERVKECRRKQQPVLIGTISVEKNEMLSAYLTANGIPHEILNAKNHEREGEIIAQAGRPGAVTLATNMAGRGVDIKLGGVPADKKDEETVIKAGGLFVLGTERHESRRIDNQLRGRAARQGDPGETQFLVSTDDDLMRIFAGERLKSVMTRLNVPEDEPIELPMITKLLESAQRKVESHNFDIRKHLLEYDDVLNRHRHVIYKKRRNVLEFSERLKKNLDEVVSSPVEAVEGEEPKTLSQLIFQNIKDEIETIVSFHTNHEDRGDWNLQEIYETAATIFPISASDKEKILSFKSGEESKLGEVKSRDEIVRFLIEKAKTEYESMRKSVIAASGENGKQVMLEIEKGVLLRAIDTLWVDHLVSIDYLRTAIGLRGYGQRDPLVEYKKETFDLFSQLQNDVQREVVYSFFKVGIGVQIAPTIMATDKLTLSGATKELSEQATPAGSKLRDESGHKVGRNDPCPCDSGKKYKRCHGA